MLLHCTPPACTKSRARTGSAVRRGAVRSANPTLHERGGGGRGSFPGHVGGAGGLRACGAVCWAARKADYPPPPSVATTADGAKGGSQGAGARRQACGQAGPSVGLAFPTRQRALASSIELLPAPKLSSAQTEKRSSDHRRRGAEVGRERPGPSQIMDSFARQRSATPAWFGSMARHGPSSGPWPRSSAATELTSEFTDSVRPLGPP